MPYKRVLALLTVTGLGGPGWLVLHSKTTGEWGNSRAKGRTGSNKAILIQLL